jgi:hypothetical protein
MPSTPRLLVLLALAASPGVATTAADPQVPPLRVGLTDKEVFHRLGPPGKVSRQLLLHRSVEQWHYEAPNHLRLTFECERGELPSLRRIDRPARQDH